VGHFAEHGYPPTIRDIGGAFGITSPNGVMCHLRAMAAKGYITRDEQLSRGIEVVGLGDRIRGAAREFLSTLGE
jgi:repressor LexA